MPSFVAMDLRQLQAFLAVVDHGGFTAAAKATHTVQSNVSTHVARLERELDATLIDRSSGRPTQEGEAVLSRVRRIQNELDSLESDVSSLRGSPQGLVRVGMIGTTARWFTPHLFEEMARVAPDIQLVVTDATTRSLELRLLDGELDLGIVALPSDETEVLTTPIFSEKNIVVVPDNHELAKEQSITLARLAKHPLLLAAPGTPHRQALEELFSQAGQRLLPKIEVDGLRLLASLAFQGHGISIVPATAAPGWLSGPWRTIEVDGGMGERTVGLAARRRGMPTMAANVTRRAILNVLAHQAGSVPGLRLVNTER